MKRINQVLLQTLAAANVMISANPSHAANSEIKPGEQELVRTSDAEDLEVGLCICFPDGNSGCGNTCCNNTGCTCR